MTTYLEIQDVDRLSRSSKQCLFLFEKAIYRKWDLEAGTSADRSVVPSSFKERTCDQMWPRLKCDFPNRVDKEYKRALRFLAHRCMEVFCGIMFGLIMMGGSFLFICPLVMSSEDWNEAHDSVQNRVGSLFLTTAPEAIKLFVMMVFFVEGRGSSTIRRVGKRIALEKARSHITDLFRKRRRSPLQLVFPK